MGRRKIIDSGSVVVPIIDLELYKDKIIEQSTPFEDGLTCHFVGDLAECIVEFEKKYGPIDGKIYWDESRSLVGFTGTNVIPHEERILQNIDERVI